MSFVKKITDDIFLFWKNYDRITRLKPTGPEAINGSAWPQSLKMRRKKKIEKENSRKEEETMTQKKFSTKYLVEMALLVAIILIMAFTPLGYIKTVGIEITLIVVPVAVGAVTLGPAAGAILGGVFGITSFIQCFGMSPFGAALLGINGFLTFLVCVPTRILMGWLTGLIYKGLRKTKLPSGASVTISNLCCPLLNTTFFMGMLVLGFYNTEYIQSFVSALGAKNALLFILAFVGVNGLIEAIVCFIVGTAISAALKKALKYN
mgnify:CR=1 FL=1